jgi:predicted N-acetyltransferase YhbS
MVLLAQRRSDRPDIRRSSSFPDEDQRALGLSSGDAFGIDHLSLEWRRKDLHFTWFDGSGPIAHVGLLDRIPVDVGGSSERVVGLGSVITRADRRGQGYAARLIGHALKAVIAESPCPFAMLFCLPGLRGYYLQLGWDEIAGEVDVLQTGGIVRSPLAVMVRRLRGEEWPTGRVIAHERFW